MVEKGTRPDDGKGRWNVETLHEHFSLWLCRLEKHYDARLTEIKDATATALIAVKDQTAAAFAANKESVSKTEEAQKAYNFSHNDLTRKMEAQSSKFVDRERLEEYEKRFDAKLDNLKEDIGRLQQGSAAGGERRTTQFEHRQQANFTTSQIITVIFGLLGVLTFALALVQFFLKKP